MKILIIDDQIVNIKILEYMVRQSLSGEPVSFTESKEALNWCMTNEPDLVFVDYMMPPPDGLEFIKSFRTIQGKEDTPLVMITATDEKDVRVKALQFGANDFLIKPFDKAELTARAKNMLIIRQHQLNLINRNKWLADEIHKATREILERETEVILRLTRATEFRSPETGNHIVRVALFSQALAQEIGLPQGDQELILNASPMHDIGKVGTPDNILFKEGKLDDTEFRYMKNHTTMGYEIMNGSKSQLEQVAADIALNHHEKFDGSGYPNGLKGEDIPLPARICAISDVFDALTSTRCYKKAWPVEDAMNEINQKKDQHFDPRLVEAFNHIIPEVLTIKEQFTDSNAPEPVLLAS
jgi:putative two-component system response regulator